jgi:Mu transposase, C-terminal
MCLLDLTREAVLAFRVVDRQHISDAYGLVLYDALVGKRQPARAAAGLSWRVPERLIVEHGLSQEYREGCRRLGMSLESGLETPAFFQALQADFRREVSIRGLSTDRWAAAFDSYLHKARGYSPLRSREERDRAYLYLTGYNRDPAWQCPALRHFLPLHRDAINRDGAIPYDGLHYADELLAYWAGEPVTFRRSEQIEALIWVYLDGSLLCSALARELRRRDGSYRSHRPGRL